MIKHKIFSSYLRSLPLSGGLFLLMTCLLSAPAMANGVGGTWESNVASSNWTTEAIGMGLHPELRVPRRIQKQHGLIIAVP